MKYSRLHVKTQKLSKEYNSINATLLIKAGFVSQTMAGVYSYLPLGLRVLTKIENIIREEMDKIGAEILMPALSPKSYWETTGRIDSVDVLFKAVAANEASSLRSSNEYILNCTQEDVVTPLAAQYNLSYKDFPFAYYQIQNKFRNEPRAKSGIMRGREFRMKDLYSFHTSEKDLLDYYHNKAKPAYVRIFDRLGLGEKTIIALASGGDFTKEYSHEFQTRCEAGEDLIFHDTVNDIYYNKEVTKCIAVEDIDDNEEFKEKSDVYGEHITGMDALVKFLNIPATKCVKTLIFEADGKPVLAALRGDRDVDENKLKTILDCKDLKLASEDTVMQVTGSIVGYAGLINLKQEVKMILDDSLQNMRNFECGTNKENYHTINVNWGRDLPKPERFYDIKTPVEGDINPETGEAYKVFKAAEVGNIFPLNTKFTEAFKYEFVDKDGKTKPIYMGSYGIGSSRVMGVLVEEFHDERGMIWPEQVAPYQVHLVGLNLEDLEYKTKVDDIYDELVAKGIEVFYDDRVKASTGNKFNDADLFGMPWRVVVSKRNEGKLEIKGRTQKEGKLVNNVDEVIATIKN